MINYIQLTNKDKDGGYILPEGGAIILFRMFLLDILAQRAGLETDEHITAFRKEIEEYDIK